jgi:hypothetical protein
MLYKIAIFTSDNYVQISCTYKGQNVNTFAKDRDYHQYGYVSWRYRLLETEDINMFMTRGFGGYAIVGLDFFLFHIPGFSIKF